MKKILGMLFLMLVSIKGAIGQRGYASFKSTLGSSIKLAIAGKQINKLPKATVNVKGGAGMKVVSIYVYDYKGRFVGEYSDRVYIKPGFRTEYTMIYDSQCGLELKKTNIRPASVKKLKNPGYYYNRKFIAYQAMPSLKLNSSILESRSLPFSHFNTRALC